MNHVPWPAVQRSLVAILRGIGPDEVAAAVEVLTDAGFTAIEIPLNSPSAFHSIETAARVAPACCLIGAGTVLHVEEINRLNEAGGRLAVSPNTVPGVIKRALHYGMVTLPGVMTPSEAFTAIGAGASGLKFFPASVLGPDGVAAIKAVLPADTEIAAVGGVSEESFAGYARVGIRSFGLGSSLFKPGVSTAEIAARAKLAIAAYDAVFAP